MGGSPHLNNEVQYFQELVILGNVRVVLFDISSYTYLSGAVVHLYLNCYTYEKDCEKHNTLISNSQRISTSAKVSQYVRSIRQQKLVKHAIQTLKVYEFKR